MGYRIQHNNAIGLIRHPLPRIRQPQSIPEVSRFRADLQNLPPSPYGWCWAGGSDFFAPGKSDMEVMRFARPSITELAPDRPLTLTCLLATLAWAVVRWGLCMACTRSWPAKAHRHLHRQGREFGGSLIRLEATGFGNVYFLLNMLATKGIDTKAGGQVYPDLAMWLPTPLSSS